MQYIFKKKIFIEIFIVNIPFNTQPLNTILKRWENEFHGQYCTMVVHQLVCNMFLIAAIYATALVFVPCLGVRHCKVLTIYIYPIFTITHHSEYGYEREVVMLLNPQLTSHI